ncbi:hypothetical protein L7F22_056576 [Adiantum nelumboides]|nr:hypothetical protein [Adiantum nelumboides]
MKAFNSNKPLYLFLCGINATLLLLILMSTSHTPPNSSSGDSFSLRSRVNAIITRSTRKNMALASSLLKSLPHPSYYLEVTAIHSGTRTPSHLVRRSKFISARRSLLHLAEDKPQLSTTKVAPIKANPAAAAAASTKKVNTNHAAMETLTNNSPHDHLPHHEVDVSATFHVDYSGPKTHPPKNN